jgi:hypothetical protein
LCLRQAQWPDLTCFGRGEMRSAAFVGATRPCRSASRNNRRTPEQLTFGCSCLFEPGNLDRGQTNQKIFMTNPAVRNDTQIDRVCSAAICEEMGDRLRIDLTAKPERLPQHMRMLVEQMALNDRVSALLSAKGETAVN